MDSKGHIANIKSVKRTDEQGSVDDIVLDKIIFSNVFEKDIRRVYIYKKSERLAKAIHLVAPAFKDIKALRDRIHRLAVDLVDASVPGPAIVKETRSRELRALSSVLSMARSAGILSVMNVDIIRRETHQLLQEIAGYEDPRLSLGEAPSLASLLKATPEPRREQPLSRAVLKESEPVRKTFVNGHASDKKDKNGRRDSILSIVRSKGPVEIKDISTLIRDVSEKTIQRELQALIDEGKIKRTGERRWTRYAVSSPATPDTEPVARVDEEAVLG